MPKTSRGPKLLSKSKSALARGLRVRALGQTVAKLAMATKRHEVDANSDAGLVVDVDLSILGQDEQRFSEYERQIRQEYAWVPEGIFASKRVEILQSFVAL